MQGFGTSVDIEGRWAVIGAPREGYFDADTGAAWVYTLEGGRWVMKQKLDAPPLSLGQSFVGQAVAIDGGVIAIGGPGQQNLCISIPIDCSNRPSGSVQLYRFDGNAWSEEQLIQPTDTGEWDIFGVKLSLHGDRLLVGSPNQDGAVADAGIARLYQFDGSAWSETQRLMASDGEADTAYGNGVDIWGKRMIVSAGSDDQMATFAGAVYVYEDFQCSDGLDGDGDGQIDMSDPDCLAPWDETEWHLDPGDILLTDNSAPARLLRVDPGTGAQTVLAQGAPLVDLYGVALSNEGEIYLADGAGRRIHSLDPEMGGIRPVARDGRLNYPRYFSVGEHGLITLPDSPSDAVYRVVPGANLQMTIASGSNLTIPIDAVIEQDGHVVVSDYASASLVRIDPDSGAKSIVSSLGLFGLIWDIEIAADGSFFVSDVRNMSLLQVDPLTGDQTQIASFGDVRGIALEAGGGVLVADPAERRLWRVDPTTGAKTSVSVDGEIVFPMGVAVVPEVTSCNDGIDNDGDGFVDLDDTGCESPYDLHESGSQCGLGAEFGLIALLLRPLMGRLVRREQVRIGDVA
jgi:sugar lactone lactonase YvrE